MLYAIGIMILICILYRYRLLNADAGSSEFYLSLLISVLIICILKAAKNLN